MLYSQKLHIQVTPFKVTVLISPKVLEDWIVTLTAAPVSAGPHMSSCSPHYPECPQTLPNVTGGRRKGREGGEGE